MPKRYSLGVDTSCYTTSIAIMDQDGQLVYHDKIMLTVKEGHKGLRQSDAFYQHMFNLEKLIGKASANIAIQLIEVIVVSERPRNLMDSYMPVFNSGVLFAKYLSHSMDIPIIMSNHQQNHILSTMYGSGLKLDATYISFHLSGGTTDILKSSWNGTSLDITPLGGSLDISFGQLVDRLGVKLGYGFPCGKAMDENTLDIISCQSFIVKFKELYFNLSGYENKFDDALKNSDENNVIVTLFNTIVKILDRLIKGHFENDNILLTGGVSANSRIKRHFNDNPRVSISDSLYAMDHAIGNSYLGFLNMEQ